MALCCGGFPPLFVGRVSAQSARRAALCHGLGFWGTGPLERRCVIVGVFVAMGGFRHRVPHERRHVERLGFSTGGDVSGAVSLVGFQHRQWVRDDKPKEQFIFRKRTPEKAIMMRDLHSLLQ